MTAEPPLLGGDVDLEVEQVLPAPQPPERDRGERGDRHHDDNPRSRPIKHSATVVCRPRSLRYHPS
jgi:hypothetical protein